MMTQSHKTKQYLLAALKVFVLAITFGYIYYKLTNGQALSITEFLNIITEKGSSVGFWFLGFLLLSAANWFFEILKWQIVVSSLTKIDFPTALKQSLASHTVSLATPNRIGDYGAKAYFFEASKRKKILLLNLYSNGMQMLITTLFGFIGIVSIFKNFKISLSVYNIVLLSSSLLVLGILGYFLKEKELLLKGFSIGKVIRFFKSLPLSVKLKIPLFSGIRYMIFSGMFYSLLYFFGANTEFSTTLPLIFAMYLLVSIVPTLFIFDVVVRGGVAVWLFSFIGIPELTVLSAVLAMWLLNFAFPAFVGSFYVLTHQPATQ